MFRIYRALATLLLWPQLVPAQAVSTTNPEPPSIHITTHIVYVDLVVRDPRGQIVHGLTQKDFKLSEDRKTQHIDFFSPHSYDPAAAAGQAVHAPSKLPSNEYSNMPPSPGASGTANMILLDLVNTPQADQLYARRQLLKFLTALPSGRQIALFVLSDRLHMIQNFTSSSDQLIAIARQIDPRNFHLIRSPSEQMQDSDVIANFAMAIGRDPGGTAARLKADRVAEDLRNADIRARITVGAFADLARAIVGYPGRKNLLWLSEDFPLIVTSQLQVNDLSSYRRLELDDVPGAHDALSLIADTGIAVYPISLGGLETNGVGASTNGVGEVSAGGGQMGGTLQAQFLARQQLRSTMEELARGTGGEAFLSTNDLAGALQRSLDEGSNYYTLAYRPTNQDWNGQLRHIHVDMATKGYSLAYRRGYFANPDTHTNVSDTQELKRALHSEAPESTMLLLRSRVQPPGSQKRTVQIDSILDPANVAFLNGSDGHRRAELLVLLVALGDGGSQLDQPPQTSGMLRLDFTADQYKLALTSGIPFHQEIELKPGKYHLRLGVSDFTNHRIGTLSIPLDIGVAESLPGR